MKKTILYAILIFCLIACSSDDVSNVTPENPPSVLGKLYLRSSFIINSTVDANADNLYSDDLMEEKLCFDLSLRFKDDFTVSNPTFDAVALYVRDDGNGNLSQDMVCSHADGSPNDYRQSGNEISFLYNGEIKFTGTLSADETTITFEFTNDQLFGFNFFEASNEILKQDGTIEVYEGGATVVYTLQE